MKTIRILGSLEVPRRCCAQCWTPAEQAIKDAMLAVEESGAHPLLTEAVILLDQAFSKVADHTDLPDESGA